MKTYIKTALILFIICGVCTALCALVNSVTAPVIAASDKANRDNALLSVSAPYSSGKSENVNSGRVVSRTELYDGSKLIGYVLDLKTKGYGGDISLISAYRLDGSIIGSKVVSDSETAGLGKKSEEDWYMEMFEGKGGNTPIPTAKNMLSSEDSDAVSGASVTFQGVSAALKEGSEYVKEIGGQK